MTWPKRLLGNQPVLVVATLAAAFSYLPVAGRVPVGAYLEGIDVHTLVVLFCLMAVTAGFREQGFLIRGADALVEKAAHLRGLASALVAACFAASMFVTNDVALIVFVPFAFVALTRAGHPDACAPTVVLQTVAANIGSSLSPVGNPQNIYLQSHYGLSIAAFFTTLGPLVAVGAVLIIMLTVILVPRLGLLPRMDTSRGETTVDPGRAIALCVLFVASLLCVVGMLPDAALLVLTVVVLLIGFRGLFRQIDYALLATFVCFFVLVVDLQHLPVLDAWLTAAIATDPYLAAVGAGQVHPAVPHRECAAPHRALRSGDAVRVRAGRATRHATRHHGAPSHLTLRRRRARISPCRYGPHSPW